MILRTGISRKLDENRTKSVRATDDFYPKFERGFNAGNPVESPAKVGDGKPILDKTSLTP
jgi:hypothetical protein